MSAASLSFQSAQAQTPPVPVDPVPLGIRITSFVRVQQPAILSELCGVVTGLTPGRDILIRVTMDPGANRPGFYQTLPGPDGRFCLLGFSYTGYAYAEIFSGQTLLAKSSKGLLMESPQVLPATLDLEISR